MRRYLAYLLVYVFFVRRGAWGGAAALELLLGVWTLALTLDEVLDYRRFLSIYQTH